MGRPRLYDECEQCGADHYAKGLCQRCYARERYRAKRRLEVQRRSAEEAEKRRAESEKFMRETQELIESMRPTKHEVTKRTVSPLEERLREVLKEHGC